MRQRVGMTTPTSAETEVKVRTKVPDARLWHVCFLSFLVVRLASAVFNTVHDCDEVYNYWEPLHYLLHGWGLQTWENRRVSVHWRKRSGAPNSVHSPQFALRSYLYLPLHACVASPAQKLTAALGKRATFHALRAALGVASATVEASLCRAAAVAGGRRLGVLTWGVLLPSSGMFTSSTTLLPSSFTMTAYALGNALLLRGRPQAAVAVCVAGGLIGWPFSGLAAVPLGLLVLVSAPLRTLVTASAAAAAVLLPSVALDTLFYGRLTSSVWNLVRYNVSGNDSSLYGTEGPLFYLLNTFNAFNVALPLALGAPLAEACVAVLCRRSLRWRLLALLSSLHLWMGVMSLVPHKEERFMYVVYPQICLGAAMSMDALCELGAVPFIRRVAPFARRLFATCAAAFLVGMGMLSVARTAALLGNYGAPMTVFKHLPPTGPGAAPVLVCVGAEWYRFPSSFYLPEGYRLGFVKTDFGGLLPAQFDAARGGAAYGAAWLNDRNQEAQEQYVARPARACRFWVGLREEAPPGEKQDWALKASAPFLDAAASPPLLRAFHIPVLSAKRNRYTELQLLVARGKGEDAPA